MSKPNKEAAQSLRSLLFRFEDDENRSQKEINWEINAILMMLTSAYDSGYEAGEKDGHASGYRLAEYHRECDQYGSDIG